MSIFNEQIEQRKNADNESFRESFDDLREAVMGKKARSSEVDDLTMAQDSISAILRFFHVKSRELPEHIKNIDEMLEYQLSPYGIMSRTSKLKEKWFERDSGVMLAKLTDSGRTIALIPAKISGYRYYDPSREKFVKVNKKNEKNISREVTVFYRPFPQGKIGITGLIRYIIESLKPIELIKYGIIIFLETQLGLVLIDILDALVGQNSWIKEILDIDESGTFVTVAFIGMAIFTFFTILFKSLFGIIHSIYSSRIETNLEFHVSSAAMMRVLSLPPSFFSKYSSGELYERIQYVNELASELVEAFLTLGAGGIFSYAYTVSIFTNAPSLLIPALIITLITVCISASTIMLNMHRTRQIMIFQAQESGLIYALISGVRKLRLAGSEKRAFAKWASLYKKEAKHLYRPPLFIKLNSTIVLAVNLFGTAVIYYIAIINHVQVKDYFAFSAAYGILSSTISSIAMVATSLATIKPTLEMAEPILNAMPEVTGNRQIVNSISGAVELNNVTFSYDPDSPPIIDNITLKIKRGQYIAIVGETGCGKSTLMRLMLGFEKPKRGSVFYDGRDLQSLDVRSVRRRIGVVMQGGNLFAGNVLTNITITAPQATEQEAWEAAEMAGMADDIRNMPMGMQTMISEGTGGISGGQKQRLLIARAIAQKPKILMFDEATSALDNITQRIVSESLDKLKCTRIVIAHRLSTIKNCDRIVVLEKGKITEDGTFNELMNNGGFFTELVKRQLVESVE